MRNLLSLSASVVAVLPVSALAAAPAAGPEAAAETGGLPQLETSTYVSQVFWLLIAFLILYLLCARIFLPRLGGIIEERRNRIANDFDKAAEYKREAEEAQQAFNQALADARARAAQIASETRARIDEEIAEMTADADREIEADIAAAEERIRATGEEAAAAVRRAAHDTTKAVVNALIDETPSDDAVENALSTVAA